MPFKNWLMRYILLSVKGKSKAKTGRELDTCGIGL
jgi:hypothetical protein